MDSNYSIYSMLSLGSSYRVFSLLVSCLSVCIYKRSAALCCITRCYYHWHCEPVCQTQRASSPWCWFRGRCGCCWEGARILCWSQGIYTANTQTGSYHNHINMPVAKAVPLHSTSETTVIKENKLGGGLTGAQTPIFLSFFQHKNFFPENRNHGYGPFSEV